MIGVDLSKSFVVPLLSSCTLYVEYMPASRRSLSVLVLCRMTSLCFTVNCVRSACSKCILTQNNILMIQ